MALADIAKTFTVKELPESEVELAGEVPFDAVAPYQERALNHIAEHLSLPGFRPGKVPTDVARKKVGEQAVLEEAVELFVKDFYPELVQAHTLAAVGRPEIRITKLAMGNPVGLAARTAVYPTVVLPKKWKNLHTQVALEAHLPASNEEVAKTLEDVRQSRKKDDVVPELNDEFAKSVGAFENLDALKEQIKKGIGEEKARAAKDVRRGKLIEQLLKDTAVVVPKLFVESELEKIMGQMREDIQRLARRPGTTEGMGMKFDDYLKHAGKTEEGLRQEFREQAAKRAKLQLALNKLAEEEHLEADPAAVEDEMKHALQHFPEANPELVKVHIETVMRNEKALKLLEGTTEESPR